MRGEREGVCGSDAPIKCRRKYFGTTVRRSAHPYNGVLPTHDSTRLQKTVGIHEQGQLPYSEQPLTRLWRAGSSHFCNLNKNCLSSTQMTTGLRNEGNIEQDLDPQTRERSSTERQII